jgi:Fic family protein
MRITDFSLDLAGKLVRIPEGGSAFVPAPLPPGSFQYSPEIVTALSEADAALGRLDGMGRMLPDPEVLIQPFLRREAVMSSRIEGTQTTLPGLLLFEAAQSTNDATDPEAQEVANYIIALQYGLRECQTQPISKHLVLGMHQRLMKNVGEYKTSRPGRFRTRQVYVAPKGIPISGARYVPPPADDIDELFSHLEAFIGDDTHRLPLLVKLAFSHYQFEAIHPFLDGNGRIGRLLLALMLCTEGRLSRPMLYLSAYFEHHRQRYYDLLLDVSKTGNWSEWLLFFLNGVREQAEDAVVRTHQLFELQKSYHERFSSARSTTLIWRLINELFVFPIITAPIAQRRLNISYPTARDLISKMTTAQILQPLDYPARARYYVAQEVIDIIERPHPNRDDDESSQQLQVTQGT